MNEGIVIKKKEEQNRASFIVKTKENGRLELKKF